MEIVQDVGNIIIKHADGSESHIIPPEFGDFDSGGEIRSAVVLVVSDELGVSHDVSEHNHEEVRGGGIYSVDRKTYKSGKYKLDVIQDDYYCGASGGTEQIILALLGGVAGGIAGAITTRIFDLVVDKLKTKYSASITDRSFEEKQRIIERVLIKQFKAKNPTQYLHVRHRKNVTECEIEDSYKNRYWVEVKERDGVLHLDAKKKPND